MPKKLPPASPKGMQARKKTRQVVSRGNRYTPAQKEEAIRNFQRLFSRGSLAYEAASIIGIPLQTIYRWEREAGDLEDKTNTAPVVEAERAIEALCSAKVGTIERRNALVRFAFWLRWPFESIDSGSALLAYNLFYLRQKGGFETLADLPSDELSQLVAGTSLQSLVNLFVGETFYHPARYYRIPDTRFTERQVLANLCWYFLASERDAGMPATVQKATFLMRRKAFQQGWRVSESTTRRLLSRNFPALPFLYVEEVHSDLSFNLNPEVPTFADEVDQLLAQPEGIQQYFANCKWAIAELQRVLHPRALANFKFPAIPKGLRAVPVEPPPLTTQIVETLRNYTAAYEEGIEIDFARDLAAR